MNRFVFKNGSNVNMSSFIRRGVLNGSISYVEEYSKPNVRLDHYAEKYYGDSSLWWIIAAASGIGWWLQVTPNVILYIPTSISEIENLKSRI